MTTDGGARWTKWKETHLDFGAVDWADTGKRILGLRHEKAGLLTTSEDAGATWRDLEKGFSGCGVMSASIFVATKEKEKGIWRSTDAGGTWKLVSPETPTAAVPVVFEGIAYWPTGKTLLVSRDQGATWNTLATVDATHGPYFNTAEHFVVVGKGGFSETKDAGKTWQAAAPLPPGFGTGRVGPNFAWDARKNLFYASTMSKPTFKLDRSH